MLLFFAMTASISSQLDSLESRTMLEVDDDAHDAERLGRADGYAGVLTDCLPGEEPHQSRHAAVGDSNGDNVAWRDARSAALHLQADHPVDARDLLHECLRAPGIH